MRMRLRMRPHRCRGAAGSVWLVPNHRRWIWPVGKLRERIELPDVSTAMDGKTVALESLSASPRVFYIHNLVSEEEMKAIKATTLAINDKYGKLQPSTVGAGAEMRRDPTRTSDSAFVPSSSEAMTIKRRSFELLRIAPYDDMQVGGLQVLRYRAAQAYRDHHDYFPADTSGSGDEACTSTVYHWNSPVCGFLNVMAPEYVPPSCGLIVGVYVAFCPAPTLCDASPDTCGRSDSIWNSTSTLESLRTTKCCSSSV